MQKVADVFICLLEVKLSLSECVCMFVGVYPWQRKGGMRKLQSRTLTGRLD